MRALPANLAAIDAPWLTAALAPRHPGVRVDSVEVVEQHEATNAHAHLELRFANAAGAPQRLFAKLPPMEPARRAAILATGMGAREALFYERLAPDLGLRVPRVHFAGYDPGDGAFLILLEDLRETGCTVPDGTRGVAADAAARALEDLFELHDRFEDAARRRSEAAWVAPPMHDPGYAAPMLRHGLERHPERLGEAFAGVARVYLAAPDALHALWQQGPTTLIHGDPHLGNLFDDSGRTGFLDWGILSTGTPLRDVSYFLCLALDVEVRRRHERDLLRHYLDLRRAAGHEPIAFDAAWESHRIHAAYSVVASCQIVRFPAGQSPSRRVFGDAFLARARAAVEDLESLAALAGRGLTL